MTARRKWTVDHLRGLLGELRGQGYTVCGPRIHADAVIYDEIDNIEQLPVGWHDSQAAGHYQIQKSDDPQLFGYALGPQSWRKYLQPPREQLWTAVKDADTQVITVTETKPVAKKMAFLGIRACELQALAIHDNVFLNSDYQDNRYALRREELFLIAVNCTHVVSTCFCTSMGNGPKAAAGFDLAITEVNAGSRHFFAVTAGSERGESLLERCGSQPLSDTEQMLVTETESNTRQQVEQNQQLDNEGIKQLLYNASDSEHWQTVADRCLSCANCTMVCPTCFCSDVGDKSDIDGQQFERSQHWDSCFSSDFSYLHGGSVRNSTASRYRQWLSHKLATWHDQFGESGCVGCGRCVSWCPVGIDLRDEVQALRITESP